MTQIQALIAGEACYNSKTLELVNKKNLVLD